MDSEKSQFQDFNEKFRASYRRNISSGIDDYSSKRLSSDLYFGHVGLCPEILRSSNDEIKDCKKFVVSELDNQHDPLIDAWYELRSSLGLISNTNK